MSAAIESDDSVVDDDELSNLFENKTSRRVGDETLLPPSEEKSSTSTSSTPIQCPTCFQYFSLEDIAQHADLCVNRSYEFMAFDDVDALVIDDDIETSASSPNPDNSNQTDLLQQIKSAITVLAQIHLSADLVRLFVRRKYLWEDFCKAARKRIGPTTRLKIVFLGEPAIDDGGT